MDSSRVDGIPLEGFAESLRVDHLYATRCSGVPVGSGVYVVLWIWKQVPTFRSESCGGWFKGKNPSYSLDLVRANWVEGANVVYVGKAAGREGLRCRVRQLVDFGFGKRVGHRGGRLLWHLAESPQLLIRWREMPAAAVESAETNAIARFKAAHQGKRPFANMNK